MKRAFFVAFVLITNMLLFSACGDREAYVLEEDASSNIEDTTVLRAQPPHDDYEEIITPSPYATTDESVLSTESIQLIVEDIPQGVEPAEFLYELGYDSFVEHDFLRWGSDWIALRANAAIYDLRIIYLIPRYEASFADGWQFVRHYSYLGTRLSISLVPNEPLVMAWWADGRNIAERGLEGMAFVDVTGSERFFVLQYNGGVTYLEELENPPHTPDIPKATIVHPSPEIELVLVWITDLRPPGERDGWALAYNFLQQFESYTEFYNPSRHDGNWLIFGANKDLEDFQFFELGHVCNPWIGDEFHLFYISTVHGSQEVLPFGVPVAVPWCPGGSLSRFGISFLDENGQRRYFAFGSNEGSGFQPMFVFEFIDREYCPSCVSD